MSILILAPASVALKPLCLVFEHSGIPYDTCSSWVRCLQQASRGNYTALVVIHTDTHENLLNNYNQWKKLRRRCAFIVISKRQSGVERAQALNEGITSYHITPFSYTQLVRDVAQYEYNQEHVRHLINAHGFQIDTVSRTVTFHGKFVKVTRKQFDLLTMFVQHPGRVFSRVQIWERIWTNGEYPLANTVDVHVNRLRRCLPSAAQPLIETLYGFGYRMKPR